MIPTIIINLERNQQRKISMDKKIKQTCLNNFIYMDAVDGKNDIHKYNFKIIPNFIDPEFNIPMNIGYIGCTLSHYFVWKYIVENNIEKMLILEDDTVFLKDFDVALKYTLNLDLDYDMFYLNRWKLNKIYKMKDEIEINEHIVIPNYSYNASSYIMTYAGAKKMLDTNCLNYFLPVDELLPIMYDNDYPHKNYSQYYDRYPKLKTYALKTDIANQESRSIFPSDIRDSESYDDKQL
jgi:collagen beta-1,O-galactosyltransferase